MFTGTLVLLATSLGGTLLLSFRFGLWSVPSFVSILFVLGFPLRALVVTSGGNREVFDGAVLFTTDDVSLATGTLTIAYLGMLAAILITARARDTRRTAQREVGRRSYSPRWLITLFSFVIGIQLLLLASEAGGLGEAIAGLSRRTLSDAGSGLATNLTFLAMPALLLAIAESLLRSNRKMVGTLIVVYVLSAAWFSLVNGRAIVVVALFALVSLRASLTGKRPRASVVGLIGAAVALVTVGGLAWRTAAQSGTSFLSELADLRGGGLEVISDAVPLFDHLLVGVSYASSAGTTGPGFLLDALAVLIPRSIWLDKPLFMPQILGEEVGRSGLSGLPAGLLGEGFISAGWTGAVLFAVCFGGAVGIGHRLLSGNPRVTPTWAWLHFTVFFIALVAMRTGAQGGLIAAQVSLLFLLPLLVAALPFSRVSEAPRRANASGLRRMAGAGASSTRRRQSRRSNDGPEARAVGIDDSRTRTTDLRIRGTYTDPDWQEGSQ